MMNSKSVVALLAVLTAASMAAKQSRHATAADKSPAKPNIIFILADDLGYADLGCYGQKKIHTPNVDRLAAAGLRFTQFYCGNAVCAPSRCCWMTGKHPGHAAIRNNSEVQPEGQKPIPADTITVAKLLKARGYATGAFGKWGLGPVGSSGDPNRHGFDLFFGYNCQRHAHNYYPTFLRRNDEKVMLDGNDGGRTGKMYSHDVIEAEALKFIRDHKDRPFFAYMPFTIPHLALQVPEDSLAEYRGKFDEIPYDGSKGYQPHPTPRAALAAMITRLDRSVGRIVELVKQLGIDDNTIILFSSDNGPAPPVGGADSEFFNSMGPLRNLKGSLYEGGIRVPCIARWTGKIKPGATSDTPFAFWDLMPTLCELTGATAPKDIDGVSFVPTMLRNGPQRQHEFLYWEIPAGGGQQAVRMGDWKGVRQNVTRGELTIQLYNLKDDIGEKRDLAAEHPDLVKRIEMIMKEQHTPSKEFPMRGLD